MIATDKPRVLAAVKAVWGRLGITPHLARRGPVLLAPFMDSFNLFHLAIPGLTRGAVYDRLLAEGITPADVGDVDEELAGFLFVTPSVGLVFVNASDPVPRQRFTAAHELGHFVLHREEMGGQVSKADTPADVELTDEQSDRHEREANRFAVELLMPADVCQARAEAFKTAYRACPRGPLAYHLAAEFLVSREAMRFRLQELGVGDA
ncbi:MAG TPA: ImmA/IrrE family metallo-endopeptidase [Gemmataceae bacterium]|nr:ImmA/IrrE family metallo-endopeptidase [Gemmataceae bacterium]